MKNKVIPIIAIMLILCSISVQAVGKSDLKEFTLSVYRNYTSNDYSSVYQYLHPDIKKIVSRDEYINFQQENTDKYQMSIAEVVVEEVTLLASKPVEYRDLITGTGSYFTVNVNYRLQFEYLGKTIEREIEKDVFLFVDNEEIYLLWNPEVINDNPQNE